MPIPVSPAKLKCVPKGGLLVREGELSREIFYMKKGSLLVLKGSLVIGQIQSPSFAGEMGPLLNRPRSTTLLAKTDAVLDIHDAPKLLSKLTLQSDLGTQFAGAMLNRLEMTRQYVDNYQQLILAEYVRIMAALMAENEAALGRQSRSDIQGLRLYQERMIDGLRSHKNASEDYDLLIQKAEKELVIDEFRHRIAAKFRSFIPFDTSSFKTHELDPSMSFKSAIRKIASQIAALSRYLTDFQGMDLGCVKSEAVLIEEMTPFENRERVLRDLMNQSKSGANLAEIQKRKFSFELDIKAIADKPYRDTLPLVDVSERFGVGDEYLRSLRDMIKVFVRNPG